MTDACAIVVAPPLSYHFDPAFIEYRGSLHPFTITNVRCVSDDVAVADAKWELRNVSDGAGKLLPYFEGQASLTVKRSGTKWLIEAYRYTSKPTAAPLPTWLKRPGWPG